MGYVMCMNTVIDRSRLPEILSFYQSRGIMVNFITLCQGTAASEILDNFGLESSERALLFSVITQESWVGIKSGLQKDFGIDIPGMGIVFCIPMAGIGGPRELKFLLGKQPFKKEDESTMKDTKYELLYVISNQGYSNLVMDAARNAGAGGGTVIHARGTGTEQAEAFFGITLASEKELILIVTKSEQRNEIMKAVMKEAGMESKAKSIVFSLPVAEVAGLRLIENES